MFTSVSKDNNIQLESSFPLKSKNKYIMLAFASKVCYHILHDQKIRQQGRPLPHNMRRLGISCICQRRK